MFSINLPLQPMGIACSLQQSPQVQTYHQHRCLLQSHILHPHFHYQLEFLFCVDFTVAWMHWCVFTAFPEKNKFHLCGILNFTFGQNKSDGNFNISEENTTSYSQLIGVLKKKCGSINYLVILFFTFFMIF